MSPLFEYPVVFSSGGEALAGRIYRSSDTPASTERQPAVIVTGSWLTVKEQMADVYARALARMGYTAFTFDFSGFGQSSGALRQTEMPAQKIRELFAAVEFVGTLSWVQPDAISHVAVCATAQYVLAALARGLPLRAFASVAGWYHDTATVAAFYGGPDGIAERLDRAARATEKFFATGQLEMAPAYRVGDTNAGMFFEFDYYGNPRRGALPSWRNEMSVMTWAHWLTFDGLSAAHRVTTPTVIVHADGCVLPANIRAIHAALRGDKELIWSEGSQMDFYDQPKHVAVAVAAVDAFLKRFV